MRDMRDIVSCFNENAINVINPTCSSYSTNKNTCISPSQLHNITCTPSTLITVSSIYKITLSTNQKQLLVSVTWCKSTTSLGFIITFGDDPTASFKINTNARLFRKLKGSKLIETDGSRIELLYDISSAKYTDAGPEPVEGFHVLVVVDSEIGLALGDNMDTKKLKTGFYNNNYATRFAKASLVSRQEHFSGNSALYVTKAKFCETGTEHDIVIKCSAENEGLKHPSLSVSIDKKMVVQVKRLQWNFRGNQSVFIDGLVVDLFWDVHGWFFPNSSVSTATSTTLATSGSSSGSGCASFLLRTRSGVDHNRLWLEKKLLRKEQEQDGVDFSLLILACKSP